MANTDRLVEDLKMLIDEHYEFYNIINLKCHYEDILKDINAVINNKNYIQEDVLKYQAICKIMERYQM